MRDKDQAADRPPHAVSRDTLALSAHGMSLAHAGRLILLAVAILVLATLYVSSRALDAFDRQLLPLMDREAEAIGGALVDPLERALDLGIPPDQLVGVPEFFQQFLNTLPSLSYIALTDGEGRLWHGVGPALPAFEQAFQARHVSVPSVAQAPPAEDGARRATISAFGDIRDAAFPIARRGEVLLFLHIGSSNRNYEAQIADIRWDIWIVLLVSVLTTYELLVFVIDRSIMTPLGLLQRAAEHLRQGDWTRTVSVVGANETSRLMRTYNLAVRAVNEAYHRLAWKAREIALEGRSVASAVERPLQELQERLRFAPDALAVLQAERRPVLVRIPLFAFIFAEQLSTSFMPLYARQLAAPVPWMSEALLVSLPLVIFVGTIALATPFGGGWVNRVGSRAVFLTGALPAMAGYLLTATAGSVLELALYRALTGVGYALITIACQHYLAEAASAGRRTQSMAVFVIAVMTGAVCGTAIGAVIADRIGYRLTFVASAALVAATALLVAMVMPADQPARRPGRGVVGGVGVAFRNVRFLALVLFAALPAKIVLGGFFFYMTPLYLAELGLTQPAIGRTAMMYGASMIGAIHLGAWLADRYRVFATQVTLGGVFTGVGLLAPLWLDPADGMLVAVIVLGVCQGVASGPMLALVPILCPQETRQLGTATLLGYLRSAERIGSIAGPLLAAGLVAAGGYQHALVWIAAISTGSALLFALVNSLARTPAILEGGAT